MDLKFLLDSNAVIDFLGAKYPAEGMSLINRRSMISQTFQLFLK
jgi:hypothetical protein